MIEDHKLSDFVKVYDNMLPKDVCRNVIQLFNNEAFPVQRYERPNKNPLFNQMMMTDVLTAGHPLHKQWVASFKRVLDNYKKDVPHSEWIPNTDPATLEMEKFRIKHYNTNSEDQFTVHTDTTTFETCKRVLAMFFYLNETEEGGETWFPCVGNIKTKMGRVVVFPPHWMWPHAGLKTTGDSDKFLLSTYLHLPEIDIPGSVVTAVKNS